MIVMQCYEDYHLQRKQASPGDATSQEVYPSKQFFWGQVHVVKLIRRFLGSDSWLETNKNLHLEAIHQPNFTMKDSNTLSANS